LKIRTLKIPKKLQETIQKISVFTADESFSFKQKVTPSPFTCISYNHYSIPEFKVHGKAIKPKSRLQITGPKTNDNMHAVYTGRLSQLLVELTPASYFHLFGRSPAAIVNQVIGLEELLGNERFSGITASLARMESPVSQMRIISALLLDLKGSSTHRPVSYVDEAITLIDESRGNITVNALCKRTNISERQFNRRFTEIVGISPIQYIKIRQLHFVVNLFQSRKHKSLKDLAYSSGFYDSAHFSNNFKKLTGMTPGEFIQSKEHVALNYFSDVI
jgi:AraC-like DNA-binding protein